MAEENVGDGAGESATPEQLKALGHPLRWRIMRLCLEQPRTNRELASRLGVAPATTLRHIRTLVRVGFLAAEPVRTGERGALERPYRATGRTKGINVDVAGSAELAQRMELAVLAAHRAEMIEAGPASNRDTVRGILRLGPDAQAELHDRINRLLSEFFAREDPAGEPLSYLWSLVVRPVEQADGDHVSASS